MEDEFGNVVTTFNGSVAAALANSSGADALQGTFSVAPLDGVATFTGLLLDNAAAQTLRFSSAGLTPAVTNPISVSPAAAQQLVVTSEPPSSVAPEQALCTGRRRRRPVRQRGNFRNRLGQCFHREWRGGHAEWSLKRRWSMASPLLPDWR